MPKVSWPWMKGSRPLGDSFTCIPFEFGPWLSCGFDIPTPVDVPSYLCSAFFLKPLGNVVPRSSWRVRQEAPDYFSRDASFAEPIFVWPLQGWRLSKAGRFDSCSVLQNSGCFYVYFKFSGQESWLRGWIRLRVRRKSLTSICILLPPF